VSDLKTSWGFFSKKYLFCLCRRQIGREGMQREMVEQQHHPLAMGGTKEAGIQGSWCSQASLFEVAPCTRVGESSVKGCNPSGEPAILCFACTWGEMGKRTSYKWRKSPAIKIRQGGENTDL